MPITLIRIANIILGGFIIASGHWYCLWYVSTMHLSLEVLNMRSIYLLQPYKLYNIIFWAYELVLVKGF